MAGFILGATSALTMPDSSWADPAWDYVFNEWGGSFWPGSPAGEVSIPSGISFMDFGLTSIINGLSAATASAPQLRFMQNGSAIRTFLRDGDEYYNNMYRTGPVAVSASDTMKFQWRQFSGSSKSMDPSYTFFWGVTPERYGFFSAFAPSNYSLGGTELEVIWDTPDRDDFSSWASGADIVVPANVNYAVVTFTSFKSAFDTAEVTTRLKVNGTTVRIDRKTLNEWGSTDSFGLIAVAPNDVVTITQQKSGALATMLGSATKIGIEWII